jgi:adenine-specific DNA-methyltransferase
MDTTGKSRKSLCFLWIILTACCNVYAPDKDFPGEGISILSILNDAYLKEQLITYIGNKRRLLPLIQKALSTDQGQGSIFLDLFAGSGVVSRLGRLMGFKVIANDWEEYSRVLAESHLRLNQQDIPRLFGSPASLRDLLYQINNLAPVSEEDSYMARYYAPSEMDIHKADYRKERLFYTRENAQKIDSIRNYIEQNFPGDSDAATLSIRNLLIGLLLCESSKHTNTSGVFKAFHKGFGGHGKDALSRILGLIQLPYPVLPKSSSAAEIYCKDAIELVRDQNLPMIDVAYLDPPYNQHQYGSNYHILNTIALWDKIAAPMILNEKGILVEKAAIRKDWVKTRSPYCSKKTATLAFSELMENLRARKILISYSNDGLIPFEQMMDICEQKGNINIISNEYTKFRGGRQSNNRVHNNIEFILSVDTEKKANSRSKSKIRRVLLLREISLLEKKLYSFHKLKPYGDFDENGCFVIRLQGNEAILAVKWDMFITIVNDLSNWPKNKLERLLKILSSAACKTRSEELDRIFTILQVNEYEPDRKLLLEIPRRLRMLAHRKTRDEYYAHLKNLQSLGKTVDLSIIDRQIKQIKIQAEKRFKE